MGVDHGGGQRGRVPPEFGAGDANANCLPQILSYRYKNERSVAFEIRQNPFSAGALPRTPLRELTTLPRPLSRLDKGHPSHTPPHSAPTHLRRSPCVPPEVQPDLRLCLRAQQIIARDHHHHHHHHYHPRHTATARVQHLLVDDERKL